MRDLGLGRPDHPRGLRRHRPQRAGLPPRRRLPVRGARHHAVGRGRRSGTSCATRSPSACPASSRSTSPAAPPTAARPCSTTSASSPSPARRDDGTIEPGFRVFVAGGLGANPHPALALEEFTPREELLPTIEAILRVFDQPRQPRQQAPGPHEVARRHPRAWEELQRQDPQGAPVPARLVVVARRHPRRRARSTATRRPAAPTGVEPTPDRPGHRRCTHQRRRDAYERWERGQRRARRGQGHRLGLRLGPARRHHLGAVPGPRRDPARARRRGAGHQPPELRVPRPRPRSSCPRSTSGSTPSAWPSPAPSSSATSSPAPAPTPATSPSPSPAAWPTPSATALEEEGLAEVGGVRINISGCTNSLRPAPHLRHRLLRRRAPGPRPVRPRLPDAARRLRRRGADPLRREGAAPAGQERARGRRAGRAPLRRRARGRRDLPRLAGPRPAAPKAMADEPASDLDEFPTAGRGPDYYVDYGETGPYVAEIGDIGVRDLMSRRPARRSDRA